MKTKVLIFGILVAFVTNVAFSQSLESQLKVIFGDMLQDSKYKEARIIGRALSTSGDMKYNMEMIQARNNYNVTVNIPANTHLDQNNQVVPNRGYQWINPNDPSDLRIVPTGSYATLPPYDLNQLARKWRVEKVVTLNFLFTYNWYSDINGDRRIEYSEFNNIKRTFYVGEKVELAFGFTFNNYSLKQSTTATLHFTIQLFNTTNGDLIVKDELDDTSSGDGFSVCGASLGNFLPPGKYMICVNMSSQHKIWRRAVTTMKEYFEVIE